MKINAPENAKKKEMLVKVSFDLVPPGQIVNKMWFLQAAKYLERMLIQVQHQRERDGLDEDEEREKAKTDEKQLAIEDVSDDKNKTSESEVQAESSNAISESNVDNKNDGREKSENNSGEPKQSDVEMKEVENSDGTVVKVENNDSATEVVEADSHEKDLTIDPRTYCKLGHFHLLLEDYAKGEWNGVKSEMTVVINILFICFSSVGVSKIL